MKPIEILSAIPRWAKTAAADLLASPYTVVTPDSANPYRRMYVEN